MSISLGFVQLAELDSVAAIEDIPAGTRAVSIQAEGQNIRWRDDGEDPAADEGNIIYVGQTLMYSGPISDLRLIEAASGGIVNVTFYARQVPFSVTGVAQIGA